MTRHAIIAASLALLLTSAAAAQTDPTPPDGMPAGIVPLEPVQGGPPRLTDEIEPTERDPGAAAMEADRQDEYGGGDHEMRRDRDGRGGYHGRGGGRHGGYHGSNPHHGGMGRGAVFHFDAGEGGANFVIRCAARDTTQDCVQAILPMLDRVMPMAQPPAVQ